MPVLLHVDLFDSPSIHAAGRDGQDLFLAGLFWLSRHPAEPCIREAHLSKVARAADVRRYRVASLRLVDVGLWLEVPAGWWPEEFDHLGRQMWRTTIPVSAIEAERRKVTPRLRASVIDHHGPWCVACGWPDTPAGAVDRQGLQIDHIVPLAKGGLTEFANLTVLCAPCNRLKGTDDWDVFIANLAALRGGARR